MEKSGFNASIRPENLQQHYCNSPEEWLSLMGVIIHKTEMLLLLVSFHISWWMRIEIQSMKSF